MDSTIMHIKARYQDEVRRFQCPANLATLESSLRQLFGLTNAEITMKYTDDENDLCSITSQMELEYAASLPQPLKLVVTTSTSGSNANVTPAAVPLAEVKQPHKAEVLHTRLQMINNTLEQPNLPPHRVQNLLKRQAMIQMKLRNAPGSAAPDHPNPSKQLEMLQARLAFVNTALENPDLPSHKLENLTRKKENITAKIERLSSGDSPASEADETPANRILLLQKKLAMIQSTLQKPNLPPHRSQQLLTRKQAIEGKLKDLGVEIPLTPSASPAPVSSETDVRAHLLQQRLAMIQSALQQPNLPPHRVQNLTKRREALEAKLANPEKQGKNLEERLQKLQEVLQNLEQELANNNLPPQKRQNIQRRIEGLRTKLAKHAGTKNQTQAPMPAPMGAPVQGFTPYPAFPSSPAHPHHHGFTPVPYPAQAVSTPPYAWGMPYPVPAPAFQVASAPYPAFIQVPAQAPVSMSSDAWNKRAQNLTEKLAHVNAALEQADLPPHKLSKLASKKEALEAKLENASTACPRNASHKPAGNGQRTEKLQERLDAINMMLAQPNLPEQKRQNLMRRKEMILTKMA